MDAARASSSNDSSFPDISEPSGFSEQMSLNFPSPEYLIASTLPVQNSQQLIQDLTSTWGQVFSMDRCSLAWMNPVTRQANVLTWLKSEDDDRGIYSTRAFSAVSDENSLQILLTQEYETTDWLSLEVSDSSLTTGFIGLPSDRTPITIPAAWLTTSSLLLQSAINWEAQQTAQRLEAMAEYAAGAGHEINNPLGTITGRVGQLLRSETDEEKRRLLEMIGAQAYRIRDMIGDSMTFARPPVPALEKLNLTVELETNVKQFAEEIARRKISVWGNREKFVPAAADKTQLAVVISELLLNALAASQDEGKVIIDCTASESEGTNWAYLRVADDGVGMTLEEWEHCLNPFYSGRQAGRGLGFGLSKCWRIITQHGGKLDFSRTEDGLTEFHVWLPSNEPSAT